MTPCCIVPDLSLCTQGPCCSTAPDPSPELQAIASELALGFLWAATGRRFARTCNPITVRPCKPETCKPMSVQDIIYFEADRNGTGAPSNMGVLSYSPTLVDGAVFNIACGCKQGCCTCKADCEVWLPGPVCEITDVTIDGIPRGAGLYYMLDHHKLVFRNRGTTVIRDFDTVPLPAPFTLFSGGALTAITSPFDGKPMVELTDVGTNYTITVSADPLDINTCRQDLMIELEFPPGGGTVTGFSPNGNWTADAVSGGPSLTKVGGTLTVGFATKPNELIRVRLRAIEGFCLSAISLTQTAGSPMSIYQMQWSDLTTDKCGVDRYGPQAYVSQVALSPQAAQHDPAERVCLSVAPTSTQNTVPAPGDNCYASDLTSNLVFNLPSVLTYDVDYTFGGPGSVMAIADGAGGPSSVYTFPASVPLTVGDVVTSDIRPNGSRARLTVRSGASTTTATGRLFLTEDFGFMIELLGPTVSGSCCPGCQDYNKPLSEPGTWSVSYTYGERWPAGAAQIAGLLACEFGQILAGQDTNLPANVQSLVRQGISIEMPNPFDLVKLGLTGNKLVDLWIRAQNPLGLSHRARVWSPDLPTVRRETF